MSRRLRRPSVQALLTALEKLRDCPAAAGHILDDRWQAVNHQRLLQGPVKRAMAVPPIARLKAIKSMRLVAPDGALADWRVAPMNTDERVIAARM